ncbi:hypothetical protein JMJ55_26455 [Belnapia sp. T6]|uniref:Uncharacterized protein n=1 Tax=Belnapia mucosa TaxID=2804532 RepID=A0ABS1VB20_9PROT|nr:hypothetical protein [Belnapia mucosa]MBL6458875.1 hypothetical protein [Belnapia mucosa]
MNEHATEMRPAVRPRLEEQLAPFFNANPASRLVPDGENDGKYLITALWGDPSVDLKLDEDDTKIIDTLNYVALPERFTAIWHRDTNRLEIIFTAFPLGSASNDLKGRAFDFEHNDVLYKCAFGKSSERLLEIAGRFVQAQPSATSYRNLQSFKMVTLKQPDLASIGMHLDPISFWIDGIVWSDDLVIDVVNHLNFYMAYYDKLSPVIMVHSPKAESLNREAVLRYPFKTYPSHITARPLDDNLLHFWTASRSGDPIRRFLYNYQILEYSSFYFIEENIKRSVRKLLSAPHAATRPDELTEEILELTAASKMGDPQKLSHLIQSVVDPSIVWAEIERQIDYFSRPVVFDGGFSLKAACAKNWTSSDFKIHFTPAFPDALRAIRNALSHGREARMSAVITPTVGNFQLIQPWVAPIAAAAREVMVYRHLA